MSPTPPYRIDNRIALMDLSKSLTLLMVNRFFSAPASGHLKSAIPYFAAGHLPHKDHWIDTEFSMPGIAMVLEGEGEFRDKEKTRRVCAPFLFAVRPRLHARYGPRFGTTWHERFLTFEGPRVREWGRAGLLPEHCDPVPLPLTSAIEGASLHEQILDGLSGADSLRVDLAKCHAERWLLLMHEAVRRPDCDRQSVSRIASLVKTWEAEPPSSVDLADCARQCGMSYSHWRCEFARLTGLSPYKYLLNLRLQRAGRLLAEETRPIKEVCFACGFRNVETFHRAFRARFGLTPGTLRQQALTLKPVRS